MTLVRLNPAMPELFNIMNNVFDRSPLYRDFKNCHQAPAANILENEQSFIIELAVPGFQKEDFKIELDNHLLTISAEKAKSENEGLTVLRQEFTPASFQRTFTLSKETVDESAIEAVYENGVLNIRLAKREEAKPKPARTIAVA